MIDAERKTELQNTYDVLVKHNLWRRGFIEMLTADLEPREIGEAIDTAAGVILEYLRLTEGWVELCQDRSRYVDENLRLKKLLESHGIKYED